MVQDNLGNVQLVYSAPVLRHASKKATIPELDWDAASGTLSFHLPDTAFPLVIAFGVGTKLPDAKGGFGLSFPSFKFGKEDAIYSSSESEDEDVKKGGIGLKMPKFGKGGKPPKIKVL